MVKRKSHPVHHGATHLGDFMHTAKKFRRAQFTSGHVPNKSHKMEVDSVSAKRQKRQSEAQMIPGLGALEYGFPNSIITQLRYCDYAQIQSSTGGTASWVFRANGIFDPDYTNVGHQALFRDAYAGIYDYYTVLGSKLTVTFQSRSSIS